MKFKSLIDIHMPYELHKLNSKIDVIPLPSDYKEKIRIKFKTLLQRIGENQSYDEVRMAWIDLMQLLELPVKDVKTFAELLNVASTIEGLRLVCRALFDEIKEDFTESEMQFLQKFWDKQLIVEKELTIIKQKTKINAYEIFIRNLNLLFDENSANNYNIWRKILSNVSNDYIINGETIKSIELLSKLKNTILQEYSEHSFDPLMDVLKYIKTYKNKVNYLAYVFGITTLFEDSLSASNALLLIIIYTNNTLLNDRKAEGTVLSHLNYALSDLVNLINTTKKDLTEKNLLKALNHILNKEIISPYSTLKLPSLK